MAGDGKSAVFLALVGNAILTVLKLGAFILSGSGAMMSEAVHSFADTANQGLLFVGMRRSLRPADEKFHYGYGADRYVFALLSAMGIFVLGCGVTVYHGVHSLMHPPELSLSWVTFVVLGISILVDGYVLRTAVKEVNRLRKGKSFSSFVRSSTDPTLIAVLFEDFAATLGCFIALGGIILANTTGNPTWDSMSSIIIGVMLGVMAVWLGWRNRSLILGPAIPEELQKEVLRYLETQPSVDVIRHFRTRIVAADSFRIAADIDYNGRHLARDQGPWLREQAASAESDDDWTNLAQDLGERVVAELGDEIDKIEAEMRIKFPEIHHIDMEAD